MTSKQVFVRRVLALILSLILVFGALPVSAVETENETYDETSAYETPEETSEDTDSYEGGAETPDEEIAPVGANTLENGYYLTGALSAYPNDADWYWNSSLKELHFTKNTLAEGEEYMLKGVKLKKNDEYKVVKIENDEIKQWYPDADTDSNSENIKADKDGTFTLYFRPASKTDWTVGSGHLYIVEEEESTEEPTSETDSTESDPEEDSSEPTTDPESTEPTEPATEELKDKIPPSVTGVKYSNEVNGQQKWVDGDVTVKLTLTLWDDSDIVSFKINDEETTPEIDGDKYTFTLSTKDNIRKDSVTITIADSEGNEAEFVTDPLLIDKDAPVKEDAKTGAFEKGTSAASQVLNTLTFGLYSNDELKFTVAVDANGGSPITGIKVADGDTELSGGKVTKDSKSNRYTRTFTLPVKNDKPYDLAVTEITDEVGHTYSGKISILDLQLTADKKAVQASDKLFEFVSSSLSPSAEVKIDSGLSYEGVYTGNITGSAEISDSLNGIKETDGGLVIYFDKAEKIADVKNNDYSGIKKLAKEAYEVENIRGAFADETGKVVKQKVSFTISDKTESGEHTLVIASTGNNGNTSYTPCSLLINNTKLSITDLTYDKSWSNTPVKVSFKVKDAPAEVSVGIKSINIVDSDNQTVNDYDKTADGVYSFNSAKNTTYKISATDNFNVTSDVVEAKVSYDDKAPVVKDVKYSNNDNKSWGTAVTVSFKVEDDLSNVEKSKIVITGEDGSKVATKDITGSEADGVYSFNATKAQKYTISATDRAKNGSEPVETESVKYDPTKAVVKKVVFREATADDVKKFGIYKNAPIAMDVYVSAEGGAEVTEISALSDDKPLDTDHVLSFDTNENLYVKRFPIPKLDDAAYKFVFKAEKANATEAAFTGFKDIEVYLEDQKLLDILPEFFEVVITEEKPVIKDYTVKINKEEKDGFYRGNAGNLKATISDSLAGIDMSTLKATVNGIDITDSISNVSDIKEDSGKLVEQVIQYNFASKRTPIAKDGVIPSGKYTFEFKVKNYAGNEQTDTFEMNVDNTAPVMDDKSITLNGGAKMNKWTKDPVTVEFKANDDADGSGLFAGIDASCIKVTGAVNNTVYTVSAVEGKADTYTFNADLKQDYTIVITDKIGNVSKTHTLSNKKVLFDDEAPVMEGDFLYDGVSYGETEWKDENGVVVSFTVHDKSSKLPTEEWLSGRTDNDSKFAVTIKGASDNKNYTATQTAYDAEKGITFEFTSKKYQKYNITIKDPASNKSETYTTDFTKVESKAPHFTGYKIDKKLSDKVINILTFGIYGNDELILTVDAKDDAPSSGITSITAEYDGKELDQQKEDSFITSGSEIPGSGGSEWTGSNTFVIPVSESGYDPAKLNITVTNKVGYSATCSLADLRDSSDVTKNTYGKYVEVVVTDQNPEVGDYSVSKNLEDNSIDVNGKTIYTGSEGSITTFVKDDFAGVDADTLSVKYGIAGKDGKAVTDKDAMDGITFETTEDTAIKGKVINSDVTYDVSKLAVDGKIPSNAYVFNATAKNYAGNTGGADKTFTFYVDNTAPVLDEASYTFNGKAKMTEADWSNSPIVVKFKANDDADGLGFFAGIDASCIKVTGAVNNTVYEVKAEKAADTYSFKADLKQDYTIVITDKLGNVSETYSIDNSRVLFDDEGPKMNGEFLYDGVSYGESEWKDENGVVVSFTVHDKSGKLPTNEWLSGRTENDSRFRLSIKGVSDNKKYTATQTAYDAEKGITFEFKSKTYQKYNIVITDPASNESETYTTDYTKVSSKAPYFTEYKIDKELTAKIINILTFGIYGNDALVLTVSAKDDAPSSGIESITAEYDGNALSQQKEDSFTTSENVISESEGSEWTGSNTFVIPVSEASYDPEKLSITVTNVAGYSATGTLAELRDNGDVAKNTDGKFAEVVVTDKTPEVGDYSVSEDLKALEVDGKTIYKGSKGSITTFVKDDFAGVDADTLSVKYGIADKSGNADIDKDAMDGITYKTTEDAAVKGKVINSDVTYDVSKMVVGDRIPSNAYVFNATAKNYAGNTGGADKTFTFYVDNTAPVLDETSYTFNGKAEMTENDWTKDPITVKFKAHDDADGLGFFAGIDASRISVTGAYYGENLNKEDKTYTVTAVEGEDDTYSFKADLKQNYTIVITDKLENVSETYTIDNSRVLYDDEAPVMNGEFSYTGKHGDSQWEKVEEGVTVSFTVHDKSSKLPTKEWLSGRTITDNKSRFKVEITGVTDNDNKYTATQTDYDAEKGITFEFKSYKYQKYNIVITDPALNISETYTTDYTKVDSKAPYFTKIKASSAETTAEKLLHILTFGIYSNNDIILTVDVKDDAPSSGIKSITAEYNGNELKQKKKDSFIKSENVLTEQEGSEWTGSNSFVVPISETSYDPGLLKFNVTDIADYNTEQSLKELNKNTEVTKDYNNYSGTLEDLFELVADEKKPVFNEEGIILRENSGVRRYQSAEKLWFSGDVEASFEVKNTLSHLHAVTVDMNEADNKPVNINENCTYKEVGGEDKKQTLPSAFSQYLETTNPEGAENLKISDVEVRFNTASVSAPVNKLSGNTNGENNVNVKAESNNGETKTSEVKFYIDDVKPSITGFKFVGDGYDRDVVNTNDADSEPIDTDLVGEAVEETPYGYYFKDTIKVYVYASDIVNDSDVIGSGINTIFFKGDSIAQDSQTSSIDVVKEAIVDDLTGKAYAVFTVPAGFKGRLYAWAEDNVGNFSETKSPDDTIVESDTHNSHSGTGITINTATNRKDNKGLDLYNGDVSVTFEVWDSYSGIRDIEFTVSENEPRFKNISSVSEKLEILNTDVNSGTTALGAWTVSGKEKNIATRLTRQFTIDSKHFDCNNIKIEITAHDRTGREIVKTEKYLSIDITAPEITVVYDPVLSAANSYNGEYYFNTNRTAQITVKERNFDPADFNLTKMIALEGSVPALVGGTDWSTSYSDYSDDSTHTATVTFDTDGKFEVDFDFTDMADNAAGTANKHFDVERFYIDKTNPVIELSIDSTAAGNDRYYNATVTAHIRITEHNFTSDSAYLTYNCTATGEDNVTSTTPPPVSSWSDNGDEHTATITFDADGSYDNLTIEFTDLAKNAAEKKTEPMFYVDTKTKAPVIKDITNNMAYDGSVAPVVDYDDYNFDNGNYFYTLTRHAYNTDLRKSEVNTVATQQSAENDFYRSTAPKQSGVSTGYTGTVVSFSNFVQKENIDGIYTLEAYYIDKALNKSDATLVTFSVNRYGSVFLLGDTDTENLVADHYTSSAPDVVIREINVNPVKEQNVSISYNSSNTDLTQGSDYTITPAASGATSWHEYVYTLTKKNFDKEGEYTVTVSSKDEFDNTITNRTANEGRTCPVSFVVDNTPPEITISGVEENGAYREAARTVQIVCMDDNIDKESLVVQLDDHTYTLEELASYGDFDMVGEIDIALPVDNGSTNNRIHKITVAVSDLAKESSTKGIEKFTLSATLLEMFFRNTAAVIISSVVLAALIGLVIFLIIKRRNKNKVEA